jgi:hypothetical protein
MIIKDSHLTTKMEVWAPKYHTEHGDYEVWLHKGKVDHATGTIIVEFTKAKHLKGQRFAVLKSTAQRYPVGTNGKAPMYRVTFSALESWEKPSEVANKAKLMFNN